MNQPTKRTTAAKAAQGAKKPQKDRIASWRRKAVNEATKARKQHKERIAFRSELQLILSQGK